MMSIKTPQRGGRNARCSSDGEASAAAISGRMSQSHVSAVSTVGFRAQSASGHV